MENENDSFTPEKLRDVYDHAREILHTLKNVRIRDAFTILEFTTAVIMAGMDSKENAAKAARDFGESLSNYVDRTYDEQHALYKKDGNKK